MQRSDLSLVHHTHVKCHHIHVHMMITTHMCTWWHGNCHHTCELSPMWIVTTHVNCHQCELSSMGIVTAHLNCHHKCELSMWIVNVIVSTHVNCRTSRWGAPPTLHDHNTYAVFLFAPKDRPSNFPLRSCPAIELKRMPCLPRVITICCVSVCS